MRFLANSSRVTLTAPSCDSICRNSSQLRLRKILSMEKNLGVSGRIHGRMPRLWDSLNCFQSEVDTLGKASESESSTAQSIEMASNTKSISKSAPG